MRTNLTLDKVAVTGVLMRLARSRGEGSAQLYAKLMGSWGQRPDRERVVVPVNTDELGVLQGLGLPEGIVDLGVLRCQWKATYRHPSKPNVEVIIHSNDKPPKRRSFAVAGGTARLERVQLIKMKSNKEAAGMATKSRKKKAVEEDELDELEALEDLDDLEDLDEDDEDDEEPEDEDEDDEEEEEPPKSRSRAKKKAPAKKTRKKAVVEDDDDEEDEDEDDEEEKPKRKSGKTRQASAKTKAKSSSSKRKPPAQRPLPEGKYGPQDIAEEAGVDARVVRIFLRAHQDEFPKDEEEFRYAFGKRDMLRIVKAIKKSRAE